MERKLAVGIDIGGTFTDVWVLDLSTDDMWKGKVPSTPRNFSECFLQALRKAGNLANSSLKNIVFIIHGSTIATNTVVTRQGAKLALITTEGFRDVLQIGTTKRDDIYDLFYKKPIPLIDRRHRFEVLERMSWNGEVIQELDEKKVRGIVREIGNLVDNICICFLHAYVNPRHEQRVEEIIREENPSVSISASHKVSPVYREYERLSTTALNGYVMPTTGAYLSSLIKNLRSNSLDINPLLITGDGGATVVDDVLTKPAMTFLSGPASGVAGAVFLGSILGFKNIVSFDMGGTSCDVSLIYNGEPSIRTESYIAGYPSNLPMVDVTTIGAGGGSIAWVDQGGVPHVGPRSAGAEPGPACYGQGGEEPTVTDANLLLGRYNADFFLGGEKRLYKDHAKRAICDKIAAPLRVKAEEAASGIIRVVNENMVNAVKLLFIKSGYEPREFALMAMGGTSCSHLPFIMDDLRISELICPRMASVFCAFGALSLPVKHNFAITRKIKNLHTQAGEVVEIFDRLKKEGIERVRMDGIQFESIEWKLSLDARYIGQKFETNVPISEAELGKKDMETVIRRFHTIHKAKYTYCHSNKPIEILTFRLTVVGTIRNVQLTKLPRTGVTLKEVIKGERNVYLNDRWTMCPIYDGERLEPGFRIEGPGIVERVDTTIVIPDDKIGVVDEYGDILIRRREHA
jgi:N-methylhydantoinase A